MGRGPEVAKYEGHCVICANPYKGKRPTRKYCSKACQKAAGWGRKPWAYVPDGREPFVPNREELAWAAGFFDGEGSVRLSRLKLEKSYGRYRYLRSSVKISQVDNPETLNRFRDSTGLGTVRGPYPLRGVRRTFDYEVSGFERVQATLAMLWPFLSGPKRAQFQKVLSEDLRNKRRPIGKRSEARLPQG